MAKKTDRIHKRKTFLVIKLALLLILVFVVVRTVQVPQRTGGAFAPSSAIGAKNITAVEPASPPETSLQGYSTIVERNLFGCTASESQTNESVQDDKGAEQAPAAKEKLSVVLLGTVAGSPEISRAIIKDLETNMLNLCRTGDTVATAYVESIEKDAVVLLHQGQRTRLNLGAGESRRHDADSAEPAFAKSGTQARKARRPAKARNAVADRLRDTVVMLPKAVITPYDVDGQVEGLRITGLEEVKHLEELGLRNGDVIRAVNGHRLTSKQKAYQISKKARSQAVVNIELLRDNKIRTLSFRLS